MGRPKKSDKLSQKPSIPPALTDEGRESRLISLAYDLIEQRLLDGTATSSETTAILRLGTAKARLEKEKLEQEVRLAAAKTEAIESSKRVEELMTEAINAFKTYSGADEDEEYEEEIF